MRNVPLQAAVIGRLFGRDSFIWVGSQIPAPRLVHFINLGLDPCRLPACHSTSVEAEQLEEQLGEPLSTPGRCIPMHPGVALHFGDV